MTGKVKWFNTAKRFGFIARDDGGVDAFVHISNVEGITPLLEGDAVEFDISVDDTGRAKAMHVRKK